jgi:hypothetical protein
MVRPYMVGRVSDPGTSGRPYSRVRAQVMAEDADRCIICGHYGGANELEHRVDRAMGGDPLARANLGRAHGTSSRCGQCPPQRNGLPRACNQTKRSYPVLPLRGVTSRRW